MEKKAEKLMDVAKIGAKGQIVIPKSMRDMFGLRPGDTLLLLADESRGIAMNKLDLRQGRFRKDSIRCCLPP